MPTRLFVEFKFSGGKEPGPEEMIDQAEHILCPCFFQDIVPVILNGIAADK